MCTFVPYDATGRAVNLDTEYMYTYEGTYTTWPRR